MNTEQQQPTLTPNTTPAPGARKRTRRNALRPNSVECEALREFSLTYSFNEKTNIADSEPNSDRVINKRSKIDTTEEVMETRKGKGQSHVTQSFKAQDEVESPTHPETDDVVELIQENKSSSNDKDQATTSIFHDHPGTRRQ